MRVPHIVTPAVKVFSIDSDNLSVIPAHTLAPRTDPEPNVGITRQILGQLVKNTTAVGRHANDVSEHHTDYNWMLLTLGRLDNLGQCLLEARHKLTIWRTEAEHVGKAGGAGQDFPHDFGEPVIMTRGVDRVAWPCLLGGLVQLTNDLAGGDVPQLMMVFVVLGTQSIVGGSTNVRQVSGVLIYGWFAPRQLEKDPGIRCKHVVVDLASDFERFRRKVQLFQFDQTSAHLIVGIVFVVIHHGDLELHIVQSRYIKNKVLGVHRILLVGLLGTHVLAIVLVVAYSTIVLFELELDVGVGHVAMSIVDEVGDAPEMDG